jgi:type IV conjugative transfer system protein TraE
MAGGLVICVVLLVLVVFSKAHSTKTVFVPPTTSGTGKPFWVADSGASPEYFQLTADYIAQLLLTMDGKGAPYNIERAIAITHPSVRGVMKSEMDAIANKMQQENVTQAFYPKRYEVGDQAVVGINGSLKTWVGSKQISSKDVTYRLKFTVENGRIFLLEFKEADKKDALNEPVNKNEDGSESNESK